MYAYAGILKTLLAAPDVAERDLVPCVVFDAESIAQWRGHDLDLFPENRRLRSHAQRIADGVRLSGHFEEERRIDNLSSGDPQFWVPLASAGVADERFPVDLAAFPVVEITYRCWTDNAYPAWLWAYPGGYGLDWLPLARRWRTVARYMPLGGCPETIDAVVLRLYSTSRTTESVDFQSVRFRALTAAERSALAGAEARLKEVAPPPNYALLQEFMPLGTHLSAETARRMAELLGITLAEYWAFAFEDIVSHHHNCVAIRGCDRMTRTEWEELLGHAGHHGVKLVPMLDFPMNDDAQTAELVGQRIRPYQGSDQILAWSVYASPAEEALESLLSTRRLVEQADPRHPFVVSVDTPGLYPAFAPHFAAAGVCHLVSHAPWSTGEMVRRQTALSAGQQFWFCVSSHIHASGYPEWNSCAELRLMTNLAVANGARGLFSRAYHNDPLWVGGPFQRSLTGPFLAFSDLWLELDHRMERYNALAPLILNSRPEPLPRRWYIVGAEAGEHAMLPPGAPPVSSFRLQGTGFDLYLVLSNNVRGMVSVHVDIPEAVVHDLAIFDLSDFLGTHRWSPMPLVRHLEMFPGQARAILVGSPEVCAYWRDVLSLRLVEDSRRMMAFDLRTAHAYGLDTSEVESLVRDVGEVENGLDDLFSMDAARDKITDILYGTPAIAEPRTRVLEAGAAICACDGALCRLMARGKADLAKELGLKVVPLARELTHLRIELREGRGADILTHAQELVRRCLQVLGEIRGHA